MYYDYTQEELRAYSKSCIESLEIWARHLIHQKMVEEYGSDYVNCKDDNGVFIVNKEIREHIEFIMSKEPERVKKPVDALYVDHIIYFLCHPKLYGKLFKEALDYIYPQGKEEAREFLKRLIPIRNPLSHSNAISIRQVEQAICYSHDFVDGLKEYYKDKGEEKMWNVPRVIKITDSCGNVFDNPEDDRYGGSNFFIKQLFRPGDNYSVQVVIDPAFETSGYTIEWSVLGKNDVMLENGSKFSIKFSEEDISAMFIINCRIVSKKIWHKYKTHDGEVSILLTILPPIE